MDIFERIESLKDKGIVIDCVAVNQKNNGNERQVNDGAMPLITYTVEVMDTYLEIIYYSESCNSFKGAVLKGIEFAEAYIR
jgi:hypothetical protein